MGSSSANGSSGNGTSGNGPPGEGLVLLSSVLAIQLSQGMDADQLGTLASFFSALASNLALIALQKSNLSLTGSQQSLLDLGGLDGTT